MPKINLLQIQKHQNTLSNMNLDHAGKIYDHEKKNIQSSKSYDLKGKVYDHWLEVNNHQIYDPQTF